MNFGVNFEYYCNTLSFNINITVHHRLNYCTETCDLQKFCDDSAVVGCISKDDEDEYRAAVNDFVTW